MRGSPVRQRLFRCPLSAAPVGPVDAQVPRDNSESAPIRLQGG